MSRGDHKPPPPPVAFLYEMVIAFFEAARLGLEPVLQAIGGYDDLGLLEDGRPGPPDAVTRKFAALPPGSQARHLGTCLTATTNLGLAYVHSFRLLSFLAQGKDALPRNATKPNLPKLYDALPSALRDELSQIYKQVGSHDLEIEMSAGPFPSESEDEDQNRTNAFRSQLAYWQSRRLMHESHLSLASTPDRTITRFFIPLRSVLILDRILAEHIAPMLGRSYQRMDEQLSSRTENPKLEWKEDMIYVSLPDKIGRTLEARWKPNVTSVAPLDAETKLRHELASYVHLPDNWDGEGAAAPPQAAVDDALTFLDNRPPDIPLPHPDQGSEGAVGIYWDNRDAQNFAEATFEGDGTFAYFAAHGVPGATADKCGRDDADVSAPWPEDMLRILRTPALA